MTNRDKLLKANNLKGLEINALIQKEHEHGDEYALLRKEVHHIEEALSIQPTEEFAEYYARAEEIKATVKSRLNPDQEVLEDE